MHRHRSGRRRALWRQRFWWTRSWWTRSWRKRVGVEPTKDRLAALSGFEVRPPHRGRFSSTRLSGGRRRAEQVETVDVDAPKVAATRRHAVAIEEVEDLDRDLASVVEPIAELRRAELTLGGAYRQLACDRRHLGDSGAQEEMVVGDFIDPPHARGELEKLAHIRFRRAEDIRDVAH